MGDTRATVTLAANMDVSQILSAVNSLKNGFNGLSMPKNLTSDMEKSFEKLTQLTKQFQQQLEKGVSTKSDAKALAKTGEEIDRVFNNLKQQISDANAKEIMLKADVSKLNELETKLANLKSKLNENFTLKLQDSGTLNLLDKFYAATNRAKNAQSMVGRARGALDRRDIETYTQELDKLQAKVRTFKGTTVKGIASVVTGQDISSFQTAEQAITAIDNAIKQLKTDGEAAKTSVKGLETDLAAASKETNNFKTEAIERGRQNVESLGSSADKTASSMHNLAVSEQESANAMLSMKDQVGQLQQSTQYFFGLRNMINLFKQGVREAIQSVKELDAAMTETAVVTKYDVSDMWSMLPQYTQLANELGATTQGAYETMTLYFQQGLNQQQAFELGAETMKMARIAGLDYAETTDMMTAALRGFNMELNEASAKRINDVYSKLAAITASDTEELGTAMQRTASIAHSAGASFEGTTAFLAQAIETTREPAENIGTAMKTIIARFQEMKENPLEISEVDGEEVNYNKIDAALKTIGVDLKDTNGQFREFDQVMLEISSKWNTLTQSQQRYIATTAAGSRQQSRFIAMVSNYDRTVQLMDAANNSAGASDEQFGKTMESLEAKLNKLHNAWQRFTMGIADNGMIKFAVDGLTKFLTVTNKIIDTLSLGSGAIKSFLSIFAAFTGLKLTGRVANSLIGGLGGLVDPQSSFKQGLFGGLTGARAANSAAQARMVSDPIVAAINNLAATLGAKITPPSLTPQTGPASYKDFNIAQAAYRNLFKKQGGFSVQEAFSSLNGLSTAQQGMIMRNAPGMTRRIDRGLTEYINSLNLGKEGTQAGIQLKDALLAGMQKGKVPASEVEKIFNPLQLGKQIGGKLGQNIMRQQAQSAREYLATQTDSINAEVERRLKTTREGDTDWTPVTEQERQKTTNQVRKEYAQQYLNNQKIMADTATTADKVTQAMGSLGAGVTSTGQAFSSFGMILSNLGLRGIGTAFITLGSTISSLGMTVTSLSTVLPKAISKIKAAKGPIKALQAGISEAGLGGFAGALGAISLISAVAIGVAAVVKKSEEKAKESAKKIQETYTQAAEETTNKLSTLQDNKSRFDTLSQGIDEYGNNIGLTNEEYAEYLTLSKDIADIAPELIAGYDAEGNAIIAKGEAIDELIAKQKELQQQNIQDYTTNSAFETNIKGIRVSDIFKDIQSSGYSADSKGLVAFDKQVTKLTNNIGKAGLSIQQVQDQIKQTTGQEVNLFSPDMQDIQLIGEHYNDIMKAIEANNSNLSKKAKEQLEDAFTSFGSDFADLKVELRPLTDQIKQYLSIQDLDAAAMGLSGEFVTTFNEGLENISLQAVVNNWDGNEIKRAATEYANGFNRIAGEGSEYQEILKEVEQAQEDYLDTIDDPDAFETYQQSLKNCADAIRDYAEGANDGTVAGEAMYQMLLRSAAEIENSGTKPIMTISESLNSLTGDISEARNAYNEFSDAVKDNDFSTAAEGYSKILEEGLDEKHATGLGDNTFWSAARATLDAESLKGDFNDVKEAMEDLQPALQAGQEGYNAFYHRVEALSSDAREELHNLGVEFEDGTEGMITKIPENAFSKVAEYLGASDLALVAMLNNAQQFAQIDFSNYEALKQGLESDSRAIKGLQSGNFYMSEDTLTAEVRAANPNWDDNRVAQEIETLREKGVVTLPSKDTLKSEGFDTKQFQSDLKDIGATTQKDLVNILGATGTFNKETLQSYLEAANLYNPETFDQDYKDMTDKLTDPMSETNSTLHTIESYVATLANKQVQDNLRSGNALAKDFQQVEGLRKEVYGQEGVMDGVYQMFSLGKNAQGENLTKQEYDDARKQITDALVVARETSAALTEGKSKADYGSEQYKEYERQLAANENLIKNLNNFLTSGDSNYKKQEEEAQQKSDEADRRAAAQAEAQDKAVHQPQNDKQVQDSINEVVKAGWGDLLSNIPQDALVTPEAQSAMQVLAKNAFDPNMQVLTPEVKTALSNLGLNVVQAYDAGNKAFADKLLTTANEGANAVLQSTQSIANNLSTATQEGTNNIEQSAEDANLRIEAMAMNAMPGFAKIADNVQDEVNNFIDSINGINVPEVTPTINQGTDLVSGVAEKAVAATLGVDTTEADAKIEATQAKVQEAATQINQGATFKINVPGVKDLTKASTAASNLAKKAGTQTIGVKTGKVDTGSVKTATSTIKSTQADINVGANTEAAYNRVDSLLSNVRRKSAYIDIEAHVRKTGINSITIDGKTVNVRTAASGMNNNIPYSPVPSFGSAAKGRYGTVGPKNKGGLTLTGEKGFEIAWLPSENRSMILGAGGPQMLNLPSDAVIYNHEQSKKIVKKRREIPAGSAPGGTANIKWTKPTDTTSTSNNNNNNNNNGNGGKDKKTQDKEKENVDNAAKVIAKAGWVQVWWENMARRIEATQKKVDNSASTFDKQIKRFGTTVTSIQSTINGYRTNLKHSIALNKNEVTQAKYELKQLTNPNSWYNKKEVSYEEKTGDKSESKKMTVKLANYIKYNSKEGTYEIRQDQIDKVGLKGWTGGDGSKHPANQGLAQAIKDAAEKEINDRNSKLKTAEDNIKKAEEALEKLNNDVYETFYRWEKSINKVYLLSQKLEILNRQLAVSSSKSELQFSKLTAGVTNAAGAMSRITSALDNQRTTLLSKAKTTEENLKAAQSEFKNSLTITPYASNYLKNPDSTNARNDFIAARKAFAFLDKVNLSGDNFNYQDALNYLNQAGMSKDEYDAIKGVLDKIFEKQNNYLQAQEDSFKSIDEIYKTMSEYESFIADFEADLLSGMEEQAENQVNHLDKLNSSLSKAFKDLIDEVKNKLDERRKKEDNQKTESELAQKQQRLSMLRADTSGGHAVEIAQLEKEIAEGQQNYQRTLEDQLIEKLQQQGDAAEKQRQQQIELLTIQNQVAKETGSNLAQVKEWLKNPQANYENIRAAWLANQNYDEVPEGTREKLEHDFEEAFAKYQGYGVQIEKYDEMIDELSKLENSVDEIATNITTDRPTYTAKDLKDKGYSAKSLKKLEYSAESVLNAGYTPKEIKEGGYSAKQLADVFKKQIADKKETTRGAIGKMHQAGYSNNDIAKQFGVLNTMQTLNASGKTIQDALGKNNNATIAKVQEWINAKDKNGKKKYTNLTQTDLAGMKADLTVNGKKVTGSVTTGGKYVYANVGSTLYGQALDKNGKLTGTPVPTSIQNLTPTYFKGNKTEATQALLYAIQHQKPGSVINKDFKSLIQAAGIVGKEYQIDTGSYKVMASIGGDGNIYYNVKDGVQIWSPSKGTLWLDKYNEKRFKERAKWTTAGREYAQVLKAKGVKGYATGGLADYTGPAWLDGTPAKPELVLNAQDTKNFIALKDVLSRAIGSTSAISNEYGGDTTYEININVDHLNNDYDVDKVAERVKKIIVKDSSYRNVTQVRKFR